jgi:aryl-alcohol dehydrogenase-like predicted oxidoreductase
MQKRRLGRTGHESSVVILGTAAFWSIDQEGANHTLSVALERGINHIDVAPQYGNAQAVVGPWLQTRRDLFFLGCKTLERTRDAAWADLQNSLKLLRTDWIDLYQFHAVIRPDELDTIFGPDGAIHAFTDARDQGLVRYLGITTHGMLAPDVAREALERFDLDTIMLPINPRLYADADYRTRTERVLALCEARDVGVQVIKSIAKEPWGEREKAYNPWYEPYDTPEKIEPAVHFALSQPVSVIASAAEVTLLPSIIDAAETFAPMSEDKQAALIAEQSGNPIIFDGPHPISK